MNISGRFAEEKDKSGCCLLAEAAPYQYGYEPLYRDSDTYLLVMKRNRELTEEQKMLADKVVASQYEIDWHKRWVIESDRNLAARQEAIKKYRAAGLSIEQAVHNAHEENQMCPFLYYEAKVLVYQREQREQWFKERAKDHNQ